MVARERHGLRRTLTIGGLGAGIDRLAAGLAAAGAAPERPIVCWLPNRLEWLQLAAAAARLGVPVVGLNTRYRADELRHALQRSAAGVLVGGRRVRRDPLRSDGGRGRSRRAAIRRRRRRRPRPGLGRRRLCRARLGRSGGGGTASATNRHRTTCSSRSPRRARPGSRSSPSTTRSASSGTPLDDVRAFDVRPGDRLLLDLPMCGTFGFTLGADGDRRPGRDPHQRALRRQGPAQAIASEGVTHYNASDDMLLRSSTPGSSSPGGHALREVAFANFTNAALEVAERVGRRSASPSAGSTGCQRCSRC